jgi:maltooligosyltrehalose synthase
VVAFARAHGGGAEARAVVAVAPRLALGLASDGAPPVGARWDDTRLALPPGLAAAAWSDLVTGRPVAVREGEVRLADVLDVAPVALLAARAAG